jgi:leucine dehydrogenase
MPVFSAKDFADHEQVVFCCDPAAGLRAIIAIHNTNLGPALGGCRMWPYEAEDEAVRDVLRLSRGMTYKNALANLPLGGGKSVIIGNPRSDKSEALFRAMGRAVDRLRGRYIVAEDVGTSVEDMKIVRQETEHVSGILDKVTGDKTTRSGDPSPATAYGTVMGIRAAVKHRLGRDDLKDVKVAVQGLGHVGYRVAKYLHEAGAELWVTDIDEEKTQQVAKEFGATAVRPQEIYDVEADVFAPCALGAVINDETLPRLRVKIVAGAANNQLAEPRHGEELMKRGILYAPDYVINAGGVIDVHYERVGHDRDKMVKHVEGIYDTLLEIFRVVDRDKLPPGVVADGLAEERFRRPRQGA